MKTNIFSISFFLFIFSGCNSHQYYAEASIYGKAIKDELVNLKLCDDINDCNKRGMVFVEGGGWQVGSFKGGQASIHIYRVEDPAVADKIVDICRKIHMINPDVPVSITIESNGHIDNTNKGKHVIIRKEKIV